jgi:ribonuclease HI
VSQEVNSKARVKNPQDDEKWKPPTRGTMKLNRDVAIDKNMKLMGIGIVVRDFARGVVATQCSTRPYVSDLVVAEALALWIAVVLLGQLSFRDVILERDSLEVVKAIRMVGRNWTRYRFILEETKETLQRCRSRDISHVRRTANKAVHRIAKMVVSLNVNQHWLTSIPPGIRDFFF